MVESQNPGNLTPEESLAMIDNPHERLAWLFHYADEGRLDDGEIVDLMARVKTLRTKVKTEGDWFENHSI